MKLQKKIKIVKVSDPSLWYSKYINWIFLVHKESDKHYWCKEPDDFGMLNIVLKSDTQPEVNVDVK
jgi:hypothetical protein